MTRELFLKVILISALFLAAIAGHVQRQESSKNNNNLNTDRKVMNRADVYKFLYNKTLIKCSYNSNFSLGITPMVGEEKEGDGRVKTQYFSEYIDQKKKKHYARLSVVGIYDNEGSVGLRLKGQTADRGYSQDINYYIKDGMFELEINDMRDQLNRIVIKSPRGFCKQKI